MCWHKWEPGSRETTLHESFQLILHLVSQDEGQRCVGGGRWALCSRLAAAEVAGVQAAVADGMLLAEPGEETLETESVTAVRG